MKIHKGDTVQVISGKDAGKSGKVERVFSTSQTVLVTGVNMYKRHVKKSEMYPQGGIVELSRPISTSKVQLVCPETKKPTRVGYKIVDGVKKRFSKKSQKVV
jgi:large subunit ribosomal protein L24